MRTSSFARENEAAHQRDWVFVRDPFFDTPQQSLNFEETLFEKAAVSPGCALARVWQNDTCLVVPKGWARKPNFTKAQSESMARGWPVCLRSSGGSCVPHGPGVLNLSLFVSSAEQNVSLSSYYAEICDVISSALDRCGIVAHTGSVNGSVCDGDWNVVVGERKIAGTAQKRRASKSCVVTMVHASTFVGQATAGVEAVRTFCQRVGVDTEFRQSAHTSISESTSGSKRISTQGFAALLKAELFGQKEPGKLYRE